MSQIKIYYQKNGFRQWLKDKFKCEVVCDTCALIDVESTCPHEVRWTDLGWCWTWTPLSLDSTLGLFNQEGELKEQWEEETFGRKQRPR